MSATIADVLRELKHYVDNGGYYEKKDGTAKYLTDSVENFPLNAGSANYTYFGKLCGFNPGAWCAMFISTYLSTISSKVVSGICSMLSKFCIRYSALQKMVPPFEMVFVRIFPAKSYSPPKR